MESKIVKLSSQSEKFDWVIENFSKLNEKDGTCSDVFSVGGFKWKAKIYPKGNSKVNQNHLSLYLCAVDLTKSVYAKFRFVVTSQTKSNHTDKLEMTNKFPTEKNDGRGWGSFMPLSELRHPDKGYIVNDTCFIRIDVTCTAKEEAEDDAVNERNSNKVAQTENEKQGNRENEKSSSESGEYPDAGQFFGEAKHNNKVDFFDGNELEDVGGFTISKAQAPVYKQIWLKYGHIPSTKVMPISSYPILVMVVKDMMNCILDMHQRRFVELSPEMIEGWEEKIYMAEKIEFNVGWLREHFERVKKGMHGMQKVENELLEHGHLLLEAKSRVKAASDELKKAESQMMAAKNYFRENISESLSPPDMEMYLDVGEKLLLDGLF